LSADVTDGEAAPAAADDDDDDDDADIPNEEVVYRRLRDAGPSFVAVDQLTGVRRPSSGDRPGGGLGRRRSTGTGASISCSPLSDPAPPPGPAAG